MPCTHIHTHGENSGKISINHDKISYKNINFTVIITLTFPVQIDKVAPMTSTIDGRYDKDTPVSSNIYCIYSPIWMSYIGVT